MTKNIITLFSLLLTCSILQAQEMSPHDVMRYNQSDLNGTARFKAMSGAFGAVGADVSSLQINPAGSALANFNSASFSMFFNDKSNKSNYLGNNDSDKYSGVDIGQLGAIFVFNSNNNKSLLRKFSIGINYQNTKNYRNNIRFNGTGNVNSLGDYFLQAANSNQVPLDYINSSSITQGYDKAGYFGGLAAQQAFLAYQSGLISPVAGKDGSYSANYNQNLAHQQGRVIQTSGNKGFFSANFAGQLGQRFYVGANVNLHTVDYTQNSAAMQNTLISSSTESMRFDNYLYTYGNGFSFNVGAIAKVTDNFRAGLAYESPTWFTLHDELSQGVATAFTDNTSSVIYPNLVNVYDKYKLKTPSKYTASLAYILFKRALISVDYTLVDYSKNKLSPTRDPLYQGINQTLSSTLKSASELRVGAEYKIKQFSLRGGYRYVQSPYKDIQYLGDLNSFSFGLGYDFGVSRLDLAYGHSSQQSKTSLVDMTVNNLYNYAKIKTKENTVNLTYTMYF